MTTRRSKRARSCRQRRHAAQGGRAALQRFSTASTICSAPVRRRAGTGGASLVVALGGYGRRQLCLQSDVDVLLPFDGRIGRRRRRPRPRHPASAVGPALRGRPPDLGRWTTSPSSKSTTPSSCWPCSTRRAVAGDATLLDRIAARVAFAGRPRADSRRAEAPDRRAARALQRHVLPARTRRQGRARRPSRSLGRAHDRRASPILALIDRGPADRARLDEAEEFLLRLRSILHVAAQTQQRTC